MRYLIRQELDVSKPVNLRRLSSFMKVYAGIVSRWHESKMYRTRMEKRLEERHIEQLKLDDRLKEALLVSIYNELDNNITLAEKNEVCSEVILCVQSSFINSLERVVGHKDFLPYEISRVKEDSDVRIAFKDMPVLLRVRKKVLGGAV